MTNKHLIILCSAILGTGINAEPPPAVSEQTRLVNVYREEVGKLNRMIAEYYTTFDESLLNEIETQQQKETDSRIAILEQQIALLKKIKNQTIDWRVGTVTSGKLQKLKMQGATIVIQHDLETAGRELDDLILEYNKTKSGQSLTAVKAKIAEIEDLRVQSLETLLAARKAGKSSDAARKVKIIRENGEEVRLVLKAQEAGKKDSKSTEKDKAALKERLDALLKQKSARMAEQKNRTVEQALKAIQSGEYQRTPIDDHELEMIAQDFLLPQVPLGYQEANRKLYLAICEYDRTKDGKTLAKIKELLIEREDTLIKGMELGMEKMREAVAKLIDGKAK